MAAARALLFAVSLITASALLLSGCTSSASFREREAKTLAELDKAVADAGMTDVLSPALDCRENLPTMFGCRFELGIVIDDISQLDKVTPAAAKMWTYVEETLRDASPSVRYVITLGETVIRANDLEGSDIAGVVNIIAKADPRWASDSSPYTIDISRTPTWNVTTVSTSSLDTAAERCTLAAALRKGRPSDERVKLESPGTLIALSFDARDVPLPPEAIAACAAIDAYTKPLAGGGLGSFTLTSSQYATNLRAVFKDPQSRQAFKDAWAKSGVERVVLSVE